jgi:short-subunit dehydrogenase
VPLTKGPLSMTAQAVAEAAYKAMRRGKLIVVPGLHNKIGAQSVRFAPRRMILKVVRRLHPADH